MTTHYSVIHDPTTGQSFDIRSKNGTLLIRKLVQQIGGGKHASKQRWSSYRTISINLSVRGRD